MIALTMIDVKTSTEQIVDISMVLSKDLVVENTIDEQTIIIEQNSLQEIDIGALPSQEEILVELDGPAYEGEYTVTPKTTEQRLPTANKLLREDVFIKEIPYFEVGNNSGGDTVYIGSEV